MQTYACCALCEANYPVAIYHCSVKTISRSKGQNAIAAGAYRAGEKLVSDLTGETFDYSRKSGVLHKEIILPAGLSSIDRNQLWNLVESSEIRKNSTMAREYELALPHELDSSARLSLARSFAVHLVDAYGVAVDLAVHAPGRHGDPRNHHAHLLTTTRAMTPSGLGLKTRVLDDRKTGEVGRIRERWANLVNAALACAGHEARVSHKSLNAQGSDRYPTVHLGPSAAAMERRGEASDRGDINRAVENHNFHLGQAEDLESQLRDLQPGISGLPDDVRDPGPQGGLAGLVKRGLQKINTLWPGRGETRPDPRQDDPARIQPVEPDPGSRRPSPLRRAVGLLNSADQAATRLKAWAESAQASQSGWADLLKEVEACALAGHDDPAREALDQVVSEVENRLPILEINKIYDSALRQAEKAQKIAADMDEHVDERAEQIGRAASKARYSLLVMRSILDKKIKKINKLHHQEQKISARSRKVVRDSISIAEDARALLSRVDLIGQDMKPLGTNSAAASKLLSLVDDKLSPAVKQIHKRSREIWRDVRDLRDLAAHRDRLHEAAQQSADLAGQAITAANQALTSFRDLSNACQPLRESLAKLEEQQERKPKSKPRGPGQGR